MTGSTGSAAYTWPTLTKIKTQQQYIRISYVLLLIKNPARDIRPHNGNSSIHQVPTLSIFLALFYPCTRHMHAMGHPSGLETVLSVKLVDFLSRRLSSTFRWNGRGIVCLPSRIPVFLKIKNKSRSGRKIGAVGDDKQLIVFTRPNCQDGCLPSLLTGMKSCMADRGCTPADPNDRTPRTGGVISLFSCLCFDISMKNSLQRLSSGF